MPSQLLLRVQRLLNTSVARDVNALDGTSGAADVPAHPPGALTNPAVTPTVNTVSHWAGGIGGVINDPRSITVHGTSGWASYASAQNSGNLLLSRSDEWQWSAKFNRWFDGRGVAPQYTIDPNGVVFPLIGPEDLVGDLRLTYHNEAMNSCSIGVEQCDFGDDGNKFFGNIVGECDWHARGHGGGDGGRADGGECGRGSGSGQCGDECEHAEHDREA